MFRRLRKRGVSHCDRDLSVGARAAKAIRKQKEIERKALATEIY